MKQNKLFFLVFMLLYGFAAHAQCPDFTDLYGPSVEAFYGSHLLYHSGSSPFEHKGIIYGLNTPPNSTSRHTLITVDGTDPNTGNALRFFPPEGGPVIRLGNSLVGCEAEALRYTFTVNKDSAALLLKFAVVLDDPRHEFERQPRFVVRVTDTLGNLVEPCAEYDVTSQAGIPGFKTYQQGVNGSPVHWRNWTNMSIDLSKYVGQKIRVEFISSDCGHCAHAGYVYFTASCIPNALKFKCDGSFTASAPPYFESYLWNNGVRDSICTSLTEGNISCKVTSALGCEITLTGTVTAGNVTTTDTVITKTICEGKTYTDAYFKLPPQTPGVRKYYHTLINPTSCATQLIELTLTVKERYTHFRPVICKGKDYIDPDNGFEIIQPREGVFRDTLWLEELTVDGCDTANVLELTVSTDTNIFNTPNLIVRETSSCSYVTCSFSGSETLTHFYWELPVNAVLANGRTGSPGGSKGTPQITLYFTNEWPGLIVLHGNNGCIEGSDTLPVDPPKSYHILYQETICQGAVFNEYGFNLGVQDSAGFFVYSKDLISSQGCDSTITLRLQVLPTPVVRIAPKDPVLCHAGDQITLLAITSDMVVLPEGGNVLFYHNNCDLSFVWKKNYSNDIISTTNSITQHPTTTTLYTVIATLDGCSATTSQWVVVDAGIPEVYDTLCFGEPYTKYGLDTTEVTSGEHVYEMLIQKEGCEDISFDVNLWVHPEVKHHHIDTTVCSGERFEIDGFNVAIYLDTLGVFRDTLHFISHTGCDSLVTFAITVHPTYEVWLRDTVCQDQDNYVKYPFNETLHHIAGEFTFKTVRPAPAPACDSTFNLKLTVNPVTTNIISDVIAVGDTYNKYGFHIPNAKKDTTATKDTTSYLGCDSTVILNLKVNCIDPPLPVKIKYGCKNGIGYITIDEVLAPNCVYSIDGENYQTEEEFHLSEGTYLIYVRNTVTGCEAVSTEGIPVPACACVKPEAPRLKSGK